MKDIKLLKLWYKDVKLTKKDTPKLRGYFANKFRDIELMHNHSGGSYVYKYPLVQYKVIENEALVIGIEDGVEVLKKHVILSDENANIMNLGDKTFDIKEMNIKVNTEKFGSSDRVFQYEFISPWLALSQKNYSKYSSLDLIEKEQMLKKVLIGNILSCAKGLDYFVEDEIRVKLDIKERGVKFKGNDMIGFIGSFATNFEIPDYMGIGKGVSRGFGSVKRRC